MLIPKRVKTYEAYNKLDSAGGRRKIAYDRMEVLLLSPKEEVTVQWYPSSLIVVASSRLK